MGAWGPAIFSDDFTCDVRDDYVSFLINGTSDEEALHEIKELHYKDSQGTDDEPLFWFALSLTQWKKGRLTDEVKNKALEFIDGKSDLHRWNYQGNEKIYKKRLEVLQNLKSTITSPMPERKKLRKPSWIWTSPWTSGALLCYKVIDPRCPEDLINKYILVRVIEVSQNNSSGLITENIALGLYGWVGDKIPNKNIIKQLDFIEISDVYSNLGHICTRYMRTTISKKEIKDRNLVCLECDDHYKTSIPDFYIIGAKNIYAPLGVIDISFTKALNKFLSQKAT
jgi:hypothetical protein